MESQSSLSQLSDIQTQKSEYLQIKQLLFQTAKIQRQLFKTSQKIILHQENLYSMRQLISSLYKQIFGVTYIGEIPAASLLKKSSNNFQTTEPQLLKKKKQNKNDNSQVKLLERFHNIKYYDLLNIKEDRVIYKSKCNSKYFLIDLDPEEILPDKHTIKQLFQIFASYDKEQVNELLIKLAQKFTNYFEFKVSEIFKRVLKRNIKIPDIFIQNEPLLSLSLTRLFNEVQKVNRQHRRVLYNILSLNSNYTLALFVNQVLYYTNMDYYLDDRIKQGINNNQYPPLKQFLQSMTFTEIQVMEILKNAQINGLHQTPSRRWRLLVDHSINIIQLIIHKDINQTLFIKENDQRAVLDLYAMGARVSQIPKQCPKMLSTKHFRSQKTLQFLKNQNLKPRQTIIHKPQFDLLQFFQIDFDGFQFNILEYDVTTTISLANKLINERFQSLPIVNDKLERFVKRIGANYYTQKNPFHNIYHAFTVLHGAYIISKAQVFSSLFDQQSTLAYFISAYCHDVCHTGVTNYFQEKTVSKLANRYGDASILENNSIAITLQMLAEQQTDFMQQFSQNSWKNFRKLLVQGILATDNKNHLHVLANFESVIIDNPIQLSKDDTHKMIGALLHTVDFWGTVKNFKVSYAWSKMINIEFSEQYKKQGKLEIEQTCYFKDLEDIRVVAKNQQVFISLIVIPLYKKIDDWSKGYLHLPLKRIQENIEIWKKLQKQEDKLQNYL